MSSTADMNRTAMALRLADKLRDFPNGTDPAVIESLPDTGWAMLASTAGCRPGYVPSPETRLCVLSILRTRVRYTDDPFAGLT